MVATAYKSDILPEEPRPHWIKTEQFLHEPVR